MKNLMTTLSKTPPGKTLEKEVPVLTPPVVAGGAILVLEILALIEAPADPGLTSPLILALLVTAGLEYMVWKGCHELHRLRIKADGDALTGLLNRDAFMARMELDLSGSNGTVALMFLDINKFKFINDTLGHQAGDELLVQAAHRLQMAMTNRCTLARLGGDEFGICITKATDLDIEYIARAISELFYKPFELTSGSVEVGAAVGIATYPVQATSLKDLTRYADLAMYEAKRTAQPYVFFVNSLVHNSEEELYIGSILRTALERNHMVVEYQPKLDLGTKKVVGAEALVRWDHPILGRVMPDRFIPIAEQQGLINPITEWVLMTALRDLTIARAQGLPLETISVNISPFYVVNGNLLITISKTLTAAAVDPSALIIEVTETSIQHRTEALIKVLVCLEVLGIGISIDDFGTGQSSLLYLKYLPTTEIKIDRSFVRNICNNRQDHAIVRSLIMLAHDIGCEVCAEGVETEEVKDALVELGCDTIQGWLVAKAMPMRELVKAFGEGGENE